MNKLLLVIPTIILLSGCQSNQGVITPLERGFLAQATVDNGDSLEAKRIALKAAEDTCLTYGKSFYVIKETGTSAVGANLNQDFVAFSNTLSQTFLDDDMFNQERTVTLEFDCK